MTTSTTPARRTGAGRHTLARYLVRRAGTSVILLLGVVLVTFLLTVLVPGDPVRAALGEGASSNPATVAAYEEKYGLNKSVPERFVLYLGNLLQGDLGTSITTGRPVVDDLAKAVPATGEVAFYAIILSLAVAIVLGTLAAYRRGKATDQVVRVVSLVGLSIPTFWMAILAYNFFFLELGWVRGSGRLSPTITPPPRVTGFHTIDFLLNGDSVGFFDAVSHLALPVFVLSLFTIALLTRFIRTSVLEVLDADYARAARAKGLSGPRVVFGYVLRGAALPILTMVGIAFGTLLSGTVLVEAVFAWPGLGTYAYNAAKGLDLLAVTGVGLVVGVIYLVINLVIDILYGALDPRVRLS
ncbi:ABC transporter permease [Microbacterium sp. zg.Y625]|uniref:ABC transporter permease n=1 Tax=Microbacterium jiangjiandongii TaxID=3049071 RepID=UPI00214C4EEE|nr:MULTISPECIES: ABC transporter permease [unclassified Microbacterium]MCR2793266.1 ABC transporter permease [Microbacterium sp. zg.Y625]MCR2815557.1 ABC transporter permease [Microbacterium sp. zg.Y843]WIM25357.1 ABC transporter permease [Microbacterium sp. zg-Y625]